jgi:hypothetical protein
MKIAATDVKPGMKILGDWTTDYAPVLAVELRGYHLEITVPGTMVDLASLGLDPDTEAVTMSLGVIDEAEVDERDASFNELYQK